MPEMQTKKSIPGWDFDSAGADTPCRDFPFSEASEIRAQASNLLDAGLSLIPIARGSKRPPDGFGWKEFQTRRADVPEVENWLRSYPGCGIGIVGGGVSGSLEILDLEARADLNAFYDEAERRAPGLTGKLPQVETPSGGRHVYYRCETIEGNQKLAEKAEGVDYATLSRTNGGEPDEAAARQKGLRFIGGEFCEIKTLIETRGEGGQVLSPLCPAGVHPSGGVYRLINGDLSDIPVISPEERNELLSAARSCNQFVDETRAHGIAEGRQVKPTATWNGMLRPGDDYNNRLGAFERSRELLQKHGWKMFRRVPFGEHWSRPGVEDHSSATLFERGILWVFSTNAGPLQAERAYAPFALFAELECNGNFKEAARQLSANGFGDRASTKRPEEFRNSYGIDEAAFKPREYPAPPNEVVYRGVAGDMIKAIEPHSEADPFAMLIQLLTAFGNLIGRNIYFRAEADRHYTNLFCVGVGATSKGRKGTGLGHIKAQLALIDEVWASRCVVSGMATGEGLVWAVRDEITKQEPVREKSRIVEYQTIIADEGVTDKRLLSVESEFSSILKVGVRDSNTLTALLRQAWDDGNLRTLTKSNPVTATGALVSLIGHITKDELLRYLDDTEVANGFANRILWYCCKRSKLLPEGGNVDGVNFKEIRGRMVDAYRFAQTQRELSKDDAAKALWAKEYPRLSEGHPGLLGAVTARAEAQTMRLACIFAVLDCSEVIRLTHLESALAVWDYCERSARYIFGDRVGDPCADQILDALLKSGSGGITRTEISNLFKRNASANQISRAINTLIESGKIRHEKQVTDGSNRPTDRYFSQFDKGIETVTFKLGETEYEINEINHLPPVESGDKFVNSLNSSGHAVDDWAGVRTDESPHRDEQAEDAEVF